MSEPATGVVPPRRLVPSEREVEEGLADYVFEPLPAPDPVVRASAAERVRGLRATLSPSAVRNNCTHSDDIGSTPNRQDGPVTNGRRQS